MKKFLKQLGWMTAFMAVGTFIDWAVHSSHERLYVEPEYYVGKMVFGIVWGLAGYYVLRHLLKVSTWKGMAIGVPAVIAGFLQTKYFYQGRDDFFVFLFLVLHFLMFLPASFYIFKKHQDVFPPADPAVAQASSPARRWVYFIALLLALEALFYLYFTYVAGYQRF